MKLISFVLQYSISGQIVVQLPEPLAKQIDIEDVPMLLDDLPVDAQGIVREAIREDGETDIEIHKVTKRTS